MLTICACFLVLVLLLFPQELLAASIESVNLWFHLVFPSLFPFIAAMGLLVQLGMAERIGRLFQPIMRPLFGLRGICALPFILGLLSGYPMGAKITAMLYQKGSLTKEEAQAVLCFSNNPGPLFVIGTVGTALFHSVDWGYFLMLSILLSALTMGILQRFFLRTPSFSTLSASWRKKKEGQTALLEGVLMDSMETVTQIGGFIIFFGVLIEAFQVTGVLTRLGDILSWIFPISASFVHGMAGGLLEMTNGVSLLSNTSDTLLPRLIGCAFLLAFGGCSILGQTMGILSVIPLNKKILLFAKLIQALLAASYTWLLFPLFFRTTKETAPAMANPSAPLSADLPALGSAFFFFGIVMLLFWLRRSQKE